MCCCKTMVKITRGAHWADLRTLLCHTSFMKFVSELRGLVWYRKSASVGSEYIICCSPCRCSMVYGNKWTLNTPTHSQIICKRQVQIPFISNAPYHLCIRHPLLLSVHFSHLSFLINVTIEKGESWDEICKERWEIAQECDWSFVTK